jgi:hypothetical protein
MITEESTFIKENTLTSCSFNIADISTSSLAASNWLTLDIVIGIMVCIYTREITTCTVIKVYDHYPAHYWNRSPICPLIVSPNWYMKTKA